MRSLEQRFVRAGVEPGHAAAHHFDAELFARQVHLVDIGDLELASRRRLQFGRNVHDLIVVEVETRDRVARLRRLWLFLDADYAAARVEFGNAVALGIGYRIDEHRCAIDPVAGPLQHRLQIVAIEHVVAENQHRRPTTDEVAADDEGLREAVRRRLHCIRQVESPLRTIAQQLLETRRVLRRRDQQDVADPGEHQRRQRVVDHRLVVDRQQLLRHDLRDRVQPSARAACEDDAAPSAHLMLRCAPRNCARSSADNRRW